MKKNTKQTVLALTFIVLLNGCSAMIPDSMIKSAHQDMDKNNNGFIDYSEYLKTQNKEEISVEAKDKGMTIDEYSKWDFSRVDFNKDGKISAKELIDYVRK